MTGRPAIEWPTVIVAVAAHGLWLTTLVAHRHLPAVATVAVLGVAIAWHGSLQHEVIHGHPSRHRVLNDALGSLPLSLVVPYPLYRRLHLAHHASTQLTDPIEDTESFYRQAREWDRRSRAGRALLVANQTLLGRVLIGPPLLLSRFSRTQLDGLRRGDRELARWWIVHIVVASAVAAFVTRVCRIPAWQYALAVYVAHSLTLVRSFCEHRYVDGDASRSAVVRAGPLFSLLFLNNNLHHAHHARPGLAWYHLPAAATSLGSDDAAALGAGLYNGYFDVAHRYLLRPFDHPVHPLDRDRASRAAS